MIFRNPWWTFDDEGELWTTERFEIELKSKFKSFRDFQRWILRSTQVKPVLVEDDPDLEVLENIFPEGSNFYRWRVKDLIKRYDSRHGYSYSKLFFEGHGYSLGVYGKKKKRIIFARVEKEYLTEISEIYNENTTGNYWSLSTVFDVSDFGFSNCISDFSQDACKFLDIVSYIETGIMPISLESDFIYYDKDKKTLLRSRYLLFEELYGQFLAGQIATKYYG